MYSNPNKRNKRLDSDNDINTSFKSVPQNIDIINSILNILYEKEFPSILMISSRNFLKNIDINFDAIIQKNLSPEEYSNPSTMATIDKIKEKILNKYNEEYSFLSETLKNYQKNPENYKYLTKFRRHCNKCDKIAYHNCTQLSSGQLVCIEKSGEILYYLCIECKKCLRKNRLYLYCKQCNEVYFSSDKILEEENQESFHPATWEKYHCFILKNEVMRCLNCHEYLYIMKPNNKLVCLDKNCHFSTRPDRIMWNCSKCGIEFLSPAQVYDEDLFNVFKEDIKYTLLNKHKAKPAKTLYCCGKFLTDVSFFHNKNCDGMLYLGNFNNKDIIVCQKCEYSNYLSDFIWTCPICKNEINPNNSNDATKKVSRNQSIRVNKKQDKINNDKIDEIEKKYGDFTNLDAKTASLKTDTCTSANTNRDTCTNTYSSTSTNVNNNSSGNSTYVQNKDKEVLITSNTKNNVSAGINNEIKKTKSFSKEYVGKSKQMLLNKRTLQEDKNNLLDSLRNTLVYSTLEKKNKMFKIKNRPINSSNQKNKEKENIQETKPQEKFKVENLKITRRSVYLKSDKKSKFALENNLQIDSENICSNFEIVNFDSEILKNKMDNQKTTGNENLYKRKNEIIPNYVSATTTNNNPPYKLKRAYHRSIYRKIDSKNNYFDIENNDDIKSVNFRPSNKVEKILTNNEPLSYNKKNSSAKKIRLNAGKIKCNNFKVINANKTIDNNEKDNESISPIRIYKHNTSTSNYFSNKNRKNTLNIPDVKIEKIINVNKSNRDNNNKSTGKINVEGEFKNRGRRYYQLMAQSASKNKVIDNKENENKKIEDEIEHCDCVSVKQTRRKDFDKFKFNSNSKNITKKFSFKKLNNNNFRIKEKNDANLNNNLINSYNINDKKNNNDNNNNDNNNCNNNNDNNNNKNNIKNLIKIGLLNHKNLISSPDKISEIQKTCTIPSFEDNDFSYIISIGEGSYGTIYLVSEKTSGKEYALKKIICQDINDVIKIQKQFELAYSLAHKNIMKIYKLQFKCLDFTTYGINVLMEKAQMDWGMEIIMRTEKKKYYTEKELINIMKQLISALEFLQNNNVAHRDIKPQNILIYPNNVYKVADLGEAKNINMKSRLFTLKGSEMYLSPALFEGLKNKKEGIIHNVYKSDVFSLGYCFLYAMCLNMSVLDEVRKISIKNNNIMILEQFVGKNKFSNKFLELVGKMIIDSEAQRCDFIELNNMIKNFLD